MKVSAVLVTRSADGPAMRPVIQSLPAEWERIVYYNDGQARDYRTGAIETWRAGYSVEQQSPQVEWGQEDDPIRDMQVYGRYEGIRGASGDLIYVQDDDCIVSDPQSIVDTWVEMYDLALAEHDPDPTAFVVCNMPERFRHDFYSDHALVGFGACFYRDLPDRAFSRFHAFDFSRERWPGGLFLRTCDIVFTMLTPRVLVDVPYVDREFASDDGRMWRQPEHVEERAEMRAACRRILDAEEKQERRRARDLRP